MGQKKTAPLRAVQTTNLGVMNYAKPFTCFAKLDFKFEALFL